jgi:restriction endonuclease
MNEWQITGSTIFWGLLALGLGFGVARAYVLRLRENAYNARLRTYLEGRDASFKEGYLSGRSWLAAYIAESEEVRDRRDEYLRTKSHPARKAAAIVKDVKQEKRVLTERVKFLEYQLRSYEEYFPQLEEYRELLLDERVPLAAGGENLDELESADPTQLFLSREEWDRLSTSERNQLALDRYLSRSKSNWEIGRYYERYLGHLRETTGWTVTYHGALHGLEDLGRDLICTKDASAEIVQAKCWSRSKVIHEKHLFQLFGTTIHYRIASPGLHVTPVLTTTTALSDVALEVAHVLGIRVESVALPPAHYPMIKCNASPGTKEKIYHLPFDQQYDRTQVTRAGECYVATVKEAERLGFRRAFRYQGPRRG